MKQKKPSAAEQGTDEIDEFFSISNNVKSRTQAVFNEDTKTSLDNSLLLVR